MATQTLRVPARPVEDRALYDLQARQHALPTAALARELGVFERIDAQHHTAQTLADALGVPLRAVEVLTSVCAALGFLHIRPDGSLTSTEVARTYLLPSSQFDYGPLVAHGDPALAALRRAVCEPGPSANEIAVNIGALSEEDTRWFINQMHALSMPAAAALAGQPIFARVEHLLDVGGGSGSLSCALASAHSHIKCTVMELPSVCAVSREFIAAYGLTGRIECLPADMLKEPWPKDRDAVLFSNIFHDWDWDTCASFARSAATALKPGGTILLHEMLLDEDRSGPLTVACFSVTMLLYERGRQYTAGELRQLLEAAGFVDFQATATFGYYSLVQARKPS